jgi:hypothetical protein
VTERGVQGAMKTAAHHSRHRLDAMTHPSGLAICSACFNQYPCVVVTLAAEVERLRRLHEARPPYRLQDYSPAELDELLARDVAILKAREDVT